MHAALEKATVHGFFDATFAESDIIAKLPNKEETLTTMLIMTLLSGKNTNSLGFFEIQFLYEPRFVAAVERYASNSPLLI